MRFDKKPTVLTPKEVESLKEFAPLNAQQKTFVILLASGIPVTTATQNAYQCKSLRSAKALAYDLMSRRSLQPVLNRLFGLKDDDKAEFMKKIDKLLRRGSKISQAEVDALILYGELNHFLPPNYHQQSFEEKLEDLGIQSPVEELK